MVGRLELRDDFKEQAEWRREKAEQYPDDKRHLEAAAMFDRLAATVDAVPEDVFVVFSERPDVDDGLLDVERWAEMLRDVGFQSAPKNAEDALLALWGLGALFARVDNCRAKVLFETAAGRLFQVIGGNTVLYRIGSALGHSRVELFKSARLRIDVGFSPTFEELGRRLKPL